MAATTKYVNGGMVPSFDKRHSQWDVFIRAKKFEASGNGKLIHTSCLNNMRKAIQWVEPMDLVITQSTTDDHRPGFCCVEG
jgi:hypothetical protein